jgi:hypothetical protein
MEETLRADGEAVPAGGLDLLRDPMPEPGETAAAVRAMSEADDASEAGESGSPAPTSRTAEGEAVAPVSIDPPLAG